VHKWWWGTPGRLLDLASQRLISFADVKTMVLDEADKMLDLGFLPDVERLFAQTPATRHTMLFSATMPGPVVTLARRFMNKPIHIRATSPDETITQANIKHFVYRAHALDKDEIIGRILLAPGRGKTVIFTRTKRAAARLMEELNDRGFLAGAVHGDMSQDARERSMVAFKAGKKDVLIATDVAARGIDVDDVTHVINHTIPEDHDAYLHRVGRTGRAGKTGIAVTFVDWDDLHKWALINKSLEMGIPEPVETYSSSPHFFEDLNIPEGTKGPPQNDADPAKGKTRRAASAQIAGLPTRWFAGWQFTLQRITVANHIGGRVNVCRKPPTSPSPHLQLTQGCCAGSLSEYSLEVFLARRVFAQLVGLLRAVKVAGAGDDQVVALRHFLQQLFACVGVLTVVNLQPR
jgi:superfamily II DNA/RNA helicase